MAKNLRCAKCRYAEPNPDASEHGWVAMECTNYKSAYHKALVNVTLTGLKRPYITWKGCPLGERRPMK